ncbi:MAG: glycosyltransferase family 1 protein [Microcystis aeruginosa Ma_AC_P_19900807_S299]|jgi:glycosyltransferase involved in cell wall biosynthesis|nr:MAG: glycosyltransferase family 1 protein [Microcystis aeruginosa Ma_AC_P_19900807_S299]
MKIVYDHQVFTFQKYGGVSRYLYELSTRMANFDDCEVKILAGLYTNEYLKHCPPNLVNGWKRPSIPKTTRIVDFINALISKVWIKSDTPDILHETYYTFNSIAANSSKTKKVITVYDMIHEKLADSAPKSANLFLVRQKDFSSIKLQAIKRADHVICISNNTKKDLINIFDIDPQKIAVVYLGYSLSSEPSVTSKLCKQNSYHPYILYVGQRGWYKNFSRLVQAYASHSSLNSNFNLLCTGGQKFSQDELNLIDGLGLSEDKVIHINGNDQTLAKLYSQASAFVYPSLYEGFGIPILEAMSFGCPVVCSNTSSFPEVAGNAAEFFDPYDIESIANALEKVLFDSDLTKKLVELGKARVKNFSWEKCAEQTHSIYASLL